MRFAIPLLLLFPTISFAQTKEMVESVERKLAKQRTAKWILELEAPEGGFYLAPRDPKSDAAPKPLLRATNGAVRALKYLGSPLLASENEKHAKFVLRCYDPKTGAFAELGGKPDVAITSIGVMAAAELGIPHEKYAKAMDYLKANARTFEEVRIGAAAVEAWGVKDCPFDMKPWLAIMAKDVGGKLPPIQSGGARVLGSVTAFTLRLGIQQPSDTPPEKLAAAMDRGQLPDGGWAREGAKDSDVESTYRVMRAYMLLKQKPKDVNKLRAFIESHRNEDNGYATRPGDKSTMSGVYYASIVTHWLDEMEKK
jgi:hypothetical protein